ncbi:DNA recombination protein RmuC [Alphaproteobacteria bacterium]
MIKLVQITMLTPSLILAYAAITILGIITTFGIVCIKRISDGLKALQPLNTQTISTIHDGFQANSQHLQFLQNSIGQNVQSILISQQKHLELLHNQLVQMVQLNENKLENVRATVEGQLNKIQEDNSAKLEKIRLTVEEKLHNTLEKRLGESFQVVSERLEMVYRGLGEMQALAVGVGDLKKVLSNVKTRGIWGEVQLGAILEQLLIKEQYAQNVAIRENSQDRVEFAIKLPGKDSTISYIMLPIDAKFPLADYQRLVEAQDNCNIQEIEVQYKLLESNMKKSAKTISEKYIHPPYTTDFAIMFLPVEGLYAEILRRPGLVDTIQREYKVIVTGPTTLSAIISSLQMGFRTLAIEKRASDVWKLLDIVKGEFIKLGDMLSKTRIKLEQAGQAIIDVENKSRMIQNKLHQVEQGEDKIETL